MTFHIITLFPRAFDSYLGESILMRAIQSKKIKVKFYNPRDYTNDKWRRVDQKPYGGGPGMVLEAESILKAVAAVFKGKKTNEIKICILTPHGEQFNTQRAKNWAKKYQHIVLICGRYEGIDARVTKITKAAEISIGPYVLTGGELAAMAIIDCVGRQLPGVLGNLDSLEEGRIASADVYTRPEVLRWKGKNYKVPRVLLSGHRAHIDAWRESTKRKS